VGHTIVDCQDPETRAAGLVAARWAVNRGELIVMPTDTVYGVACDAFSTEAVERLLASKGRGRHMPPPVLVASFDDVQPLVASLPVDAEAVIDAFWPGGVTIIFAANPSVSWDLGETQGTVALRMPDHEIALELLAATGPLAVSSANLTGQPSAHSVDDAVSQLGDAVSIYLDAGVVGHSSIGSPANPGSTIVDATELDAGGPWRVVRHGVQSVDSLRNVTTGEWDV